MKLRIVAISDTHEQHNKIKIPDGDVLIHAGDITWKGELAPLESFNRWLGRLPHKHKIVIAGNHDWAFQLIPDTARKIITDAIYLQDSSVTIEGLLFYGSPWQPAYNNWAFNLQRGKELAEKWALIPDKTDVLITHGPPFGHGDLLRPVKGKIRVGCEDLLRRIKAVRPRFHIFGHIHEVYGITHEDGTAFVNASISNAPFADNLNAPIVWDLEV